MEKKILKARNLVNKIVKQMGRQDVDFTVQVSTNSIHPDKLAYCAMIEAPANGLQPITWVCGSMEELLEKLETASKGLDADAVARAWHESEIKRAEALKRYHEEAIQTLDES